MKFEAHYYSETGNMESTEYSDNLYSLLRNYSVFWQNDKYKPTLWITEGNVSLRIHDFAFKELTPETYCAYLRRGSSKQIGCFQKLILRRPMSYTLIGPTN